MEDISWNDVLKDGSNNNSDMSWNDVLTDTSKTPDSKSSFGSKIKNFGIDIAKNTLGLVDTGAALTHQLAMGALTFPADVAVGLVGGQNALDKVRAAQNSVTLQPGMIENAVYSMMGQSSPNRAMSYAEPVAKAMNTIIPSEQINKNLKQMEQLGVPKGLSDRIANLLTSGIELAGFIVGGKGIKIGTKAITPKISGLIKRFKSGKVSPEELSRMMENLQTAKAEAQAKFDTDSADVLARQELEHLNDIEGSLLEYNKYKEDALLRQENELANITGEHHKETPIRQAISGTKSVGVSNAEAQAAARKQRLIAKGIIVDQNAPPVTPVTTSEPQLLPDQLAKVQENKPQIVAEESNVPSPVMTPEETIARNMERKNLEAKQAVEKQRLLQQILSKNTSKKVKKEVIPSGEEIKTQEQTIQETPVQVTPEVVEPSVPMEVTPLNEPSYVQKLNIDEIIPAYETRESALSDYELNRRSFTSKEQAQKFADLAADKNPEIEKPEIVKVGDKFSVGTKVKESDMSDTLRALSDGHTPESRKAYNQLLNGEEITVKPKVSPEEITTKLKDDVAPKVVDWLQNQTGDIEGLKNQLQDYGIDLPKNHLMQDAIDNMLSMINKKKAELGTEPLVEPSAEAQSGMEVLDEAVNKIKESDPKLFSDYINIFGEPIDTNPALDEAFGKMKWTKATKDLLDSLKDVLGNERGSISLHDLPSDKVTEIQKIVQKIKRRGKDVFTELLRRGYPEDLAKIIVEGTKDMEVGSKKSSGADLGSRFIEATTAKQFKEGKDCRAYKSTVRKMSSGGKEYIVNEEPLYEKEIMALKEAKEPSNKYFSALGRAVQPDSTTWESIDPNKSGLHEMIYREAKNKEAQISRMIKQEMKDQVELRKLAGGNKGLRDIFQYLVSKEEGGVELLSRWGIKDIPTLTDSQLEAAKMFREKYDAMIDYANKGRASLGIEPIRFRDNYVTHMYKQGLLERLGIIESDKLKVPTDKFNQEISMGDVPTRFAKARSELGLSHPEMNLGVVYMNYFRDLVRSTEMSPVVHKIHQMLNTYVDPVTGEKTLLSTERPRLARFLRYYGNTLAGVSEYKLPKVVENAMRTINRHISNSAILYNLRIVAIQPTSLINAYHYLGIKHFVGGIAENVAHPIESWKAAMEVPELYTRWNEGNFDANFLDMMKSSPTIPGAISKGIKSAGSFLLKAADMEMAITTYNGALKKFRSEGFSLERAKQLAGDIVIKTQGSGSVTDLAPIQRVALGKFLTLFQTYNLSDFSYFLKNVLGIRSELTPTQKAYSLFKYLFAVSVYNAVSEDYLGIKSPLPRPLNAIKEGLEDGDNGFDLTMKVLKECSEKVPILSGTRTGGSVFGAGNTIINDSLKPDYQGNIPIIQTVNKTVKQYNRGDDLSDIALDAYLSPGSRLATSLLGVYGDGQVRKVLRGVKRGAPLRETIFGQTRIHKRESHIQSSPTFRGLSGGMQGLGGGL